MTHMFRCIAVAVTAAALFIPGMALAQDGLVLPALHPGLWQAGRSIAPPGAASSDVGDLGAHFALRPTSLAVRFDSTTPLEQGHRRWNGKGALIGAGVGLALGGAVGAYLDARHLSTHGSLVPVAAIPGAILGTVVGGGGSTALRGGAIGLLIGGGAGVVVGLASDGNCDGSCGGLAALVIGGIGAGAGFVIGAVVAMTHQGDGSGHTSEDRVHLGVAPSRSGVSVRASVPW